MLICAAAQVNRKLYPQNAGRLEARLVSLSMFTLLTVLSVLFEAWVLSLSARSLGSPRGRFAVGLVVSLVLLVLSIGFAAVAATVGPAAPSPGFGWALLIAQLGVAFAVLRYAFCLSVSRTFAPFGVHIALLVVELQLAAFVIKPFVAEAFVLPTKTMSPTIEPGDRFVVNKLVRPKRLDLVTYWSRGIPAAVYCKRLIGLPGETLRFEQGAVFVNDQPVALPEVLAGRCDASPPAVPPDQARYREGESIVLGKDEYFLIGDNADVSRDSRLEGPSPGSSLVGVVDFVYWPLSKARLMR